MTHIIIKFSNLINELCVLYYFDFVGICCTTSSKIRRIVFLVCSCGLGYLFWIMCNKCCHGKKRGSIQKFLYVNDHCIMFYTVVNVAT